MTNGLPKTLSHASTPAPAATSKNQVLVLDDAAEVALLVGRALYDFDIKEAPTLNDGSSLLNTMPSLVLAVIDLMLPDGNGLDFLFENMPLLRERHVATIVVTGKTDPASLATAFAYGADDFVYKPIQVQEFRARAVARIAATQRALSATKNLEFGSVTMDLSRHRVQYLDGSRKAQEIALTRKEFHLLQFLIGSHGRYISRQEILDQVWGENLNVIDRVVDSHMAHLRRKLSGTGLHIGAKSGAGYQIFLDEGRT